MVVIRNFNRNHSNGLTRYLINKKGAKATEYFKVSYSSISSNPKRHELAPFGIYFNGTTSFHSNCAKNDWLKIFFKCPISVSSYSLRTLVQSFTSWKLQGSNDGYFWYNIDVKNENRSLINNNTVNFIPSNLSNTKTHQIRIMMEGTRTNWQGKEDYCIEIFLFEIFGKMYEENGKTCLVRSRFYALIYIFQISLLIIAS